MGIGRLIVDVATYGNQIRNHFRAAIAGCLVKGGVSYSVPRSQVGTMLYEKLGYLKVSSRRGVVECRSTLAMVGKVRTCAFREEDLHRLDMAMRGGEGEGCGKVFIGRVEEFG